MEDLSVGEPTIREYYKLITISVVNRERDNGSCILCEVRTRRGFAQGSNAESTAINSASWKVANSDIVQTRIRRGIARIKSRLINIRRFQFDRSRLPSFRSTDVTSASLHRKSIYASLLFRATRSRRRACRVECRLSAASPRVTARSLTRSFDSLDPRPTAKE